MDIKKFFARFVESLVVVREMKCFAFFYANGFQEERGIHWAAFELKMMLFR